MAQKSKSRVTAPRSYDPGKGRPKEYLAYLNYQEMQALKRLNGNNQERGPKGLPSFPPAGSMSGTSAKSPASTSTSKAAGSTTSKTTTSNTKMSSSTQSGAVKTASKTTTSNTKMSNSTQTGGGNKNNNTASQSRSTVGGGGNKSPSGGFSQSQFGGGSKAKGPAASMAAAKDSAAKAAVTARDNAKAQKNPGFKADMGRYSIGDGYKAPTGGQIKGAIAAVKSGMTPTGYAQQNLRGPLGPNAEMRKGITPQTDAYRLGQVSQNLYDKFGNRSVQEAANFMRDYARSLPAEAAVNMTRNFNDQAQRMRDLGTVGINQALNVSTNKVMRGIDTFSKPQFQKPSKISMGLVSENSAWASRARDALSDAMTRPVTVSEVARKATNFTAPNKPLSAIHRNIKEVGRTPAGRFGVDPAYEKRTNAALGEASRRLAGEPARPSPAVNRAGTPVAGIPAPDAPIPRSRPPSQNMQRPTGAYAIAGNTAPQAPAALMSGTKPIQDRVVSITTPDGKRFDTTADRVESVLKERGIPSAEIDRTISKLKQSETNDFYTAPNGEVLSRNEMDRARVMSGEANPHNVLSGPRATTAPRPTQTTAPNPSYFGDINNRAVATPSRSYFGDIADRKVATPSKSYFGDISERAVATPSRSYFGDINDRAVVSPSRSYFGDIADRKSFAPSQSYFGDISERKVVTPSRSYFGDIADRKIVRNSDAPPYALSEKTYGVETVPEGIASLPSGQGPWSGGSTTVTPRTLAPQTALPQTKEIYDRVPQDAAAPVTRGPAASMAAAKAIGKIASETQVSAPVKREDGGVESARTTIDSYVDSYPGLDQGEKAALRSSMIRDVVNGNVEFTKADIDKKVAAIKNAATFAPEGYLGPDEALPKNVSPEAQKEMERQEKINKRGVQVMKFRNPVLTLADGLRKIFTGKTTSQADAALKRQYMQSTPDQQAALEAKYPNLTRFARDVGLTPQLSMDNYTNWADKSGLRAPQGSGTGNSQDRSLGIASIVNSAGGAEGASAPASSLSTQGGARPQIYYEWDLGVNIPSPGDPLYTMYMTYLAERQAAAAAMYG